MDNLILILTAVWMFCLIAVVGEYFFGEKK